MQERITVLGSTGSIGKQALEVIAASPDRFTLWGISGGRNTELLLAQAERFHPRFVACAQPLDAALLPAGTTLLEGEDGLLALAANAEADAVVNGISGFAALTPLLASLRAGKRVALANKESIVCGKRLVDAACRAYGGSIIPVDSEQSAIFQCLCGGRKEEVRTLLLTASGGRFWKRSFEELRDVTLEETLSHPTWNMGQKITIDSASLFNKGLEIIEASYLFDIPAEQIEVVIHPQSIVHSMVEFCDGTVLANMSLPDMRLPIQYALTYPARLASPCKRLSLSEVGELNFYSAPRERYPALRLAYEALAAGGTMPTVYNGANEAAVALFTAGEIRFTDIYAAVEDAMSRHVPQGYSDIETVFAADREAREAVAAWHAGECPIRLTPLQPKQ